MLLYYDGKYRAVLERFYIDFPKDSRNSKSLLASNPCVPLLCVQMLAVNASLMCAIKEQTMKAKGHLHMTTDPAKASHDALSFLNLRRGARLR